MEYGGHEPDECYDCDGTGELEGSEGSGYVHVMACPCPCHTLSQQARQQTRRGWAEDEKDMNQIAREWRDFDTDPPGS